MAGQTAQFLKRENMRPEYLEAASPLFEIPTIGNPIPIMGNPVKHLIRGVGPA